MVVGLAVHRLVSDGEAHTNPFDENGFLLLNYVEKMPQTVIAQMQSIAPLYRLHHSQMADAQYYTNFCSCSANFGDHYLYSKPGGAFFPIEAEEARQIKRVTLQSQQQFEFDCDWSEGSAGELIGLYSEVLT